MISELARQVVRISPRSWARRHSPRSREASTVGKKGGALEFELLERTEERLSFNVTRCRYAEMYRAPWASPTWAPAFPAKRDFSLVEGFNSAIQLTRTQTLDGGCSCCNFRFEGPGDPSATKSRGFG